MGEEDTKEENSVRTLFISGLPDDIKEREIYNLFRSYRGYESCQLKYSGHGFQIVAFAIFSDQQSAIAAKEALNGIKFDPSRPSTLHIDLAKANTRAKRQREDGALYPVEKKPRASLEAPGVGGTLHLPGYEHSVYSDLNGYPPTQSGMLGPSYGVHDGVSSMMMGSTIFPPLPAAGSNPPCSTLFVANLGLTCMEAELNHLFAGFPGFLKLKMQTRAGLPVAFVEFQDEAWSTHALTQLQNHMLPSSDRGGMRLEYAKSRMGLPRRERRA